MRAMARTTDDRVLIIIDATLPVQHASVQAEDTVFIFDFHRGVALTSRPGCQPFSPLQSSWHQVDFGVWVPSKGF